MTKKARGRSGFREWADRQADPGWPALPLTHISRGLGAEDIIRNGKITPRKDAAFEIPLAYFFYGRPAYRISGDDAVKVEAACPYCFIFDPRMIESAKYIHAFDTGAFNKRLYSHALVDDMKVEDFSIEGDNSRINRIIAAAFPSVEVYIDGDISKVKLPEQGSQAWEFHARAYLQLLSSRGRNEPDDRICSVEIVFDEDVLLPGDLMAVVVPHTLWDDTSKAPWLTELHDNGVRILPYLFVPGRHPEHYHALMEAEVRKLYKELGLL